MRILFVIPTLDFADHISIAYLSSIAKESGHETLFLELNKGDRSKRIKDAESFVDPNNLDIIAYSCTIQGFKQIVDFNNAEKRLTKKRFVSILGGSHATFAPETFKKSGMDYYCVGEGEETFKEFLYAISNNMSALNIKGIIGEGNDVVIRPLIQDLNSLPFPDRDLILKNSYLKNIPKKTFYTSRGCPYSCSYCANNHHNRMYKGQKIVRRFSVDRIIDEMKHVKSKYRMDFVKIGDDLFALKADLWLTKFCDKYYKEINIPFNCYLRIDSISYDLLYMLKESGCHSVHLSIDSTDYHIREVILKRKSKLNTLEMIKKLKIIHSFGIKTWVNFMLAAPESSLQNDLDTIKVAKKSSITYTSYSMTDPIKGTDLYKYCLNNNYIDRNYKGDMSNCSNKSPLNCFSERDKDIRYNIYLLGAVIAKLPYILLSIAIYIIKNVKPNKFFEIIRQKFYKYNIEKIIFILK